MSIPGIGKKLAERIIFELKEKVAAAGVAALGPSGPGGTAGEGEIVAALQALGYSLAEAREASRTALAEVGVGSSLEERVKAALRSLLRDSAGSADPSLLDPRRIRGEGPSTHAMGRHDRQHGFRGTRRSTIDSPG